MDKLKQYLLFDFILLCNHVFEAFSRLVKWWCGIMVYAGFPHKFLWDRYVCNYSEEYWIVPSCWTSPFLFHRLIFLRGQTPYTRNYTELMRNTFRLFLISSVCQWTMMEEKARRRRGQIHAGCPSCTQNRLNACSRLCSCNKRGRLKNAPIDGSITT